MFHTKFVFPVYLFTPTWRQHFWWRAEALIMSYADIFRNVIRSKKLLQTGQDRNPYRGQLSALVNKPCSPQPAFRKESIVVSLSGQQKRLIPQMSPWAMVSSCWETLPGTSEFAAVTSSSSHLACEAPKYLGLDQFKAFVVYHYPFVFECPFIRISEVYLQQWMLAVHWAASVQIVG